MASAIVLVGAESTSVVVVVVVGGREARPESPSARTGVGCETTSPKSDSAAVVGWGSALLGTCTSGEAAAAAAAAEALLEGCGVVVLFSGTGSVLRSEMARGTIWRAAEAGTEGAGAGEELPASVASGMPSREDSS